jgi:hypothetical protein
MSSACAEPGAGGLALTEIGFTTMTDASAQTTRTRVARFREMITQPSSTLGPEASGEKWLRA